MYMSGSRKFRKFCQRASNFDNVFSFYFFLVDKGSGHPNTNLSGPSSAR